ncbi:hypothetical protein T492DRAFT_999112 [Pavlovales sp. CCMP2436]|nr:hypothetical protein T492DRAFT_999112 [Pavlovales sp. CCMP2436]
MTAASGGIRHGCSSSRAVSSRTRASARLASRSCRSSWAGRCCARPSSAAAARSCHCSTRPSHAKTRSGAAGRRQAQLTSSVERSCRRSSTGSRARRERKSSPMPSKRLADSTRRRAQTLDRRESLRLGDGPLAAVISERAQLTSELPLSQTWHTNQLLEKA